MLDFVAWNEMDIQGLLLLDHVRFLSGDENTAIAELSFIVPGVHHSIHDAAVAQFVFLSSPTASFGTQAGKC